MSKTTHTCARCSNVIPVSVIVDGKRRKLKLRRYCLKCSPFGKRWVIRRKLILDDKGQKKCAKCATMFDTRLRKDHRGPDRVQRASYCNACVRVIQRDTRRRHKQTCADYLGGKCSDCGYKKYLDALEFHHLDSEKKEFALNQIRGLRDFTKVKRELDKCVLVCCRCHVERHVALRQRAEAKGLSMTARKSIKDKRKRTLLST